MEQLKGILCAFHLKSSNSFLSVDFPDPLHEYRICVGVCVTTVRMKLNENVYNFKKNIARDAVV